MPRVETIRVGGVTVEHARPDVERHPPVLFVHGIFVDAREWALWLLHFAERGFPAYAVNLRGRAGSRPGTKLGSVSMDDYVADAAEVARFLGRPAVVGHSMGGLIAQSLASRDVVRSAVLVTPAPPRGIVLVNARLALKQARYLPRILTNRVMIPNREDLRELALNCAPRDVQDRALAELVPDSGRVGREMSLTGVAVDPSTIRCPMLVIAAEHDHFIPAAIVARIARRYDAPLRTIPARGHIINLEPGWQSLADDVAEWIASGPQS
jgi:pimeloyl-ACP methyl ester carboxylesterase